MNWVLLIPALPALSFAILLPLSRVVRNRMRPLPVAAMAVSLALSLLALAQIGLPSAEAAHGEPHAIWTVSWQFAQLGDASMDATLALDPLAAVMLVVVTFVGLCVQVYSLGYMHDDRREGWYFAVLSLFTSAMLVLVLSSNLLLTFAMWEMMGLCSYLLIGFWHELEAPRKASQKAFLTTRVGDLGFLVALFAIFSAGGTFDLVTVLEQAPEWAPGIAAVAAGGLLWAAMGKSAQVPLHVWLPDAMAGPTPASALIHAATMVAAGVFVVARTLPLFELAPVVMSVMLAIGVITAVAAGLMAGVQHDIKKVLAYSTVSQLGLMFVALGAGSATAALFHLTTHAFFKSLLFLGAGVIIHAAHTQDMREMGGLAKEMPVTTATFTVGALALAGVPPLAGFFSKDEILAVLMHEGHWAAFVFVILASGLTAFYVARLWFRVFAGPRQSEHLTEGHPTMLVPMSALALVTLVVGFATTTFAAMLGHEGEWPSPLMIAISTVVFVTGFGIGWWFYGRRSVVVNTRRWKERFAFLYGPITQKFYFDMVYDAVFVKGFSVLAELLALFDRRVVDGAVNGAGAVWRESARVAWLFDGTIIDGAVNGIATVSRGVGGSLRKLQTGRLQSYQRLVVGAVVILMLILVVSKGA